MAIKRNRFVARMIYLSFFVLIVCHFSCSSNIDNKKKLATTDSSQRDSLTAISKELNAIDIADSIKQLLNTSILKDTFEYVAFYNENSPYELLYVKSGYLFQSNTKHAIALYTANDTSVLCELYTFTDKQWLKQENTPSMHISGFSPAFFNVYFDD